MTRLNKLTVLAAAVALSVGLSACGGGGSSTTAMPEPMPEPAPEPMPDSGEVDLAAAQAAAMAAAAAAKTASDEAAASAAGAGSATENLATLQTNAMAGGYAMKASEAAGMAIAEYMKAKAASDAAAEATAPSDAGEQRAIALAAQKAAEDAAKKAADYAMKASEAADMELMIDGQDKSVGESMLNAGAGMLTTTNDDDSKTITGLLMGLEETTEGTLVKGGQQADPNADAGTEAAKDIAPRVAADPREVTVGKILDSSDDSARLMLMTHYAGTKTVRVFEGLGSTAVTEDGTPGANQWTSVRSGQINAGNTDHSENADDHATEAERPTYVSLRAVGKYWPTTAGTGETTDASIADGDASSTATPYTPEGTVGPKAKPETVYAFEDETATPGTTETVYVVLHSTSTTGGVTTNTYRRVDTMVALYPVGDLTDATGTYYPAKDVNVTAELPMEMAYEHIHFGVWAGLDDAEDDGSQTIDDLGIGFVQVIGDGMTGADMPNNGTAKYTGNWAATVQEQNAGDISLANGPAELTANLDKATLEATLEGLATLSGKIDGSSFSGEKATIDDDNSHNLTASASFEGSFSGGFYGSGAAEAAGIFDFTSEDMADGAFRGAFGGAKDEE